MKSNRDWRDTVAAAHAAGASELIEEEIVFVVPFPVVVYHWLPGEPIEPPLTSQQLAALLESVQRIHGLRLADFPKSDLPDAFFHWIVSSPHSGPC